MIHNSHNSKAYIQKCAGVCVENRCKTNCRRKICWIGWECWNEFMQCIHQVPHCLTAFLVHSWLVQTLLLGRSPWLPQQLLAKCISDISVQGLRMLLMLMQKLMQLKLKYPTWFKRSSIESGSGLSLLTIRLLIGNTSKMKASNFTPESTSKTQQVDHDLMRPITSITRYHHSIPLYSL